MTSRATLPIPMLALAGVVALMTACTGDRAATPGARATAPGVPPLVQPTGREDQAPVVSDAPPAATLLPGNDRLLGPAPRRVAQLTTSESGDVTMNFVRADIRDVARTVLGDALKLNYVIDPQVQGSITVQTSRPLSRGALLSTFEEVLRLNGAAMVVAKGVHRVIPLKDAARGGAPISVGRNAGEGFGLQVVPLRHVAAAEMRKILDTISTEGTVRMVDDARNLLILAGTSLEIEALLDTIDLFDTDWLQGMSFAIFPLQSSDAKTMVAELERIFADTRRGATAPVRLLAVERLNAVMVITPQAQYLERVRNWIERLDQSGGDGAPELFVYYVRNGLAVDIAKSLSEVFGKDGGRSSAAVGSVAPGLTPLEIRRDAAEPAPRADAPTGGLGGQSAATGGASATPATGPSAGRADRARTATAEIPATALAGGGPPLGGVDAVRIVADDSKNALLVVATPRQYRSIEATLRRLDLVPLQVMIEATVASVRLNDTLRYGVQWFLRDIANSEINFNPTTPIGIATTGFNWVFSSRDSRFALNALQSVTDLKILSSPHLLVLDNQTARLQVGDQVPVATQTQTGVTAPGAPVIQTIQFRDTGVILEVTPRVNPSGLVILDIKQEVSQASESATNTPTISQRKVSTRVAVRSGETVALGGLIEDTQDASKGGVPILMNLPILGALFRTTTDASTRTELLVLLTPRVVGSDQAAREVTDELRRRMRTLGDLESRAK